MATPRERYSTTEHGRLAERESASFTPKRSLVRSQYRPHSKTRSDQPFRLVRIFLVARAWLANTLTPRARGRMVTWLPARAVTLSQLRSLYLAAREANREA